MSPRKKTCGQKAYNKNFPFVESKYHLMNKTFTTVLIIASLLTIKKLLKNLKCHSRVLACGKQERESIEIIMDSHLPAAGRLSWE